MSENFNEQNENNQNEYGTSQNIYGNTQTTYGDTQNSYGSENNYGGTQNSYGGTQNTYGYNNQPQYQSGMEKSAAGACATDECWTVDADLFIGEHSNCKYRYVYYLADRKKSKRRNPQKLGKRTVIYGSYYIWNYVDLHNYCIDGFNAGRWKFEWLQ